MRAFEFFKRLQIFAFLNIKLWSIKRTDCLEVSYFYCDEPMFIILTGAQLRHNDFRIFADPSRIFTYNCDKTFKTTSLTLSENMQGHA